MHVTSTDPLDPTPTVEPVGRAKAWNVPRSGNTGAAGDLHDAYHRLVELQGRLNDPLGRAPLVVEPDAPHPEGNRAHRRAHRLK